MKGEKKMSLKVIAVSAPYLPEKGLVNYSLKSEDPASLFNACRYAAFLAENGIGSWGGSNWAVPRKKRRENILLMNSLKEEITDYELLIEREQPNLLLIGAMTLCLPGAVAVAKKAKEILRDKVCIVLGGWHSTETIYFDNCLNKVKHHISSPLKLMLEGYIEPVFDFIVSGESEYVVAEIGSIVDLLDQRNLPLFKIYDYFSSAFNVPGDWILGWIKGEEILTIKGRGYSIDRDELASPCSMFGVKASFDIFGDRPTAHVFSDLGRGCVYDCDFCSEASSLCGSLVQINTSAERLFGQLKDAVGVIKEDNSSCGTSAFVEDSTMLAGSNIALRKLADLLSASPLDICFGGQLTIDQTLSRIDILGELKKLGFNYLFVGLETMYPESIGGMAKDRSLKDNWLFRAEKMFEALSEIEIFCGISLLFGLGESRRSRILLFEQIIKWRKSYGVPYPISINWAVQHPRRGNDGKANYRYIQWGTPVGPFLDVFKDFGEASVNYPVAGQEPPDIEEVKEITQIYHAVLQETPKMLGSEKGEI